MVLLFLPFYFVFNEGVFDELHVNDPTPPENENYSNGLFYCLFYIFLQTRQFAPADNFLNPSINSLRVLHTLLRRTDFDRYFPLE
jgi:hypothetical protein